MIKKIKSNIKKAICIGKRIIDGEKPFIELDSNTVFIDERFWTMYDPSKFVTDKYTIQYGNSKLIRSSDYDKIVAFIGNIDKKIIKKCANLCWLQLASHGFNGYDSQSLYLNDSIVVSNLKDVFSDPISDFCIAAYYFFYSYALRSITKNSYSMEGSYTKPKEVTVTIIGVGSIGNVLAQKCKQIGWTVLGVKKHLSGYEKPYYIDKIATWSQVSELLQQSDYVINILPETNETKLIYDIDFFSKMKETAVFCNVGRGSAVVDEDLVKAVNGKIIAGAILDASVRKKYDSDNIIVTHHSSSMGPSNSVNLNNYYSSQLARFLSGNRVENIIRLM